MRIEMIRRGTQGIPEEHTGWSIVVAEGEDVCISI
jgi:hypothetical protein